MESVIDASGVRHEYPDGTTAIESIEITIEQKERVAVIGANGSGKTTLQLVLGGLVEPTAGSIEFFETTTDAEAVREQLGVLLQNPDDYLFNTTVREDIEYGPAQLGHDRATTERRIKSLADTLGLDDLLDRPPFRLSGGEKQRAAIASVFAFKPDVLLLDEPFGAVDATYRKRVRSLLSNHTGAMLVFTPSLDLVPEIANRVILMSQGGSIAAKGSVREVLTDRALLSNHGLRPPQTVQIFEGVLPTADIPLTAEAARKLLASQEF
jgi:ABC-type cobalt transport system, ATPase component